MQVILVVFLIDLGVQIIFYIVSANIANPTTRVENVQIHGREVLSLMSPLIWRYSRTSDMYICMCTKIFPA